MIARIKLGVSTAISALIDVASTGKYGPPYLIKAEIPAERIKTLRIKFA
jgi:hypothetical protein